MRLFGIEIRRAAPVGTTSVPDTRGGWFPVIRDWFAGAWQTNRELMPETVLAHHAVWSCITLIASDVAKLRARLVEQDKSTGIWSETTSPAFSPVLLRPNHFQNHIQFKEWWIISKLIRGNTYVLKQRDKRGIVVALYLLDPSRVRVLVTPGGDVYYELLADNLSGLTADTVTVPASEIMHDRMNCIFHPLVGISPIYACGEPANIGLRIQANSANFFSKGSNPSGILSAPTTIDKTTADRISEQWQAMFAGDNAGRVAVLGNDLKFTPMRMSAVDSQMLEQLKWSAETVCSTFHVPPFKIGIGTQPTYQNGGLLNQIYYSDCLQAHIESYEAVMDEGLGLNDPKDGKVLGVELDLEALLRMDAATLTTTLASAVKGGIMAPNEARRSLGLPPKPGGDSPYLQQQNYSLDALNARDEGEDPFASSKQAVVNQLPPAEDPDQIKSKFMVNVAQAVRPLIRNIAEKAAEKQAVAA